MKEDVNIVHNIGETLNMELLKDVSYISNLKKKGFKGKFIIPFPKIKIV